MNHPVAIALGRFIERYVERWPVLEQPHEAHWRSPCECPPARAGRIRWRPAAHPFTDHFEGLENALETTIHEDVKQYFGNFWSAGLEATAPAGHVSLIQLWNDEDAERLIENQIGHALNKRRARQPLSLFIACTEPESELILTIENASGTLLLENPGTRKLSEVGVSLRELLDSLEPADPTLNPDLPWHGTGPANR